jgi:hypothetical protein
MHITGIKLVDFSLEHLTIPICSCIFNRKPFIYLFIYVKALEGHCENTGFLNVHSMNSGSP